MPRAINYCLIAQKVVHLHPHRGAKEKKIGCESCSFAKFLLHLLFEWADQKQKP